MDRRAFLATAGAATVAPFVPAVAQPTVGIDFAPLPDETVYRLLSVQKGLIREIHRVTGIPRYKRGEDGIERDTWQEQIDAGRSKIQNHLMEAE